MYNYTTAAKRNIHVSQTPLCFLRQNKLTLMYVQIHKHQFIHIRILCTKKQSR